jgi:2-C-methyl-D-erythritol 4-phosphate cytidylyltransferase
VKTGDDILILLAAGSARRMQATVDDKIIAPLAGKPVLLHSLQSFLSTGLFGRVIITYRDQEQLVRLQKILESYPHEGVQIDFIQGGETRQDSVFSALKICQQHQGLVHIHDAARPLVTPDAILRVRTKALETGAAILAGRAADTVKIAHPTGSSIQSSPDRSLVWTAETPQVFRTVTIIKGYHRVYELGRKVTDDSSAVETIGQDVALVENHESNLKLTRPSDFPLAEAVLTARQS